MTDLALVCRCKKIKGKVHGVVPGFGTRLTCYCKDCRRFANHLAPDSGLLDQHGGTEIAQFPPASIEITEGREHLACLRFGSKGLYRWYAGCCKTPIANAVNAGMPLIGVIDAFIDKQQDWQSKLGQSMGAVHVKSASPPFSADEYRGPSQFSVIFRVLKRLLKWKIQGRATPNPFFDKDGRPSVKPEIVSKSSCTQ